MSEVDSVNVGERGRVAEHFDIECSDEVLFKVFGGYVFFGHAGFEGLEFIEDDFVLLLLGLSLADAFDELL